MHRNLLASVFALCLATAFAPAAVAQDAAAPILVEVQPNPHGTDRGNEWIELANPTPAPIQLDGLYVTDGSDCYRDGDTIDGDRSPLNGTLGPFERVVITLDYDCVRLANSGDTLELVTEEGDVLQTVAYGSEGSLDAPSSSSSSLSACQAGTAHATWSTATASPGAENPSCLPV